MTPETRTIIEMWWSTHSLTDCGWLDYIKLSSNVCDHKNIVPIYFNQWICESCGEIKSYDDLRK